MSQDQHKTTSDPVDFSDRERIDHALEISRQHPCAGLAPCGDTCRCWQEARNAR